MHLIDDGDELERNMRDHPAGKKQSRKSKKKRTVEDFLFKALVAIDKERLKHETEWIVGDTGIGELRVQFTPRSHRHNG
jgi:hypothetical protein